MSTKLSKLLLFFILVAALSYLYVLNPEGVTVQLSRSSAWTAPLALVLTTAFSLGMLTIALFAFYSGAKMSFRHWRDRRRWQQDRQHIAQLERVRELVRLEEFNRACNSLRRILEENPENVNARVMYAECLCSLKQYNEALTLLDEGRTINEGNVEIPLLAAEIHQEQGNFTSALDNLNIVLRTEPSSPAALRSAVICARELGNFESAIDLQQQLMRALSVDEGQQLEQELVSLLIAQAKKTSGSELQEFRGSLEQLSKRARSSALVLDELAAVNDQLGDSDTAAKLWTKAYATNPIERYLWRLSQLWLRRDEPSRAIAAVKSCIPKGASNMAGAQGSLFLAQLLLHLEMNEEALRQLDLAENIISDLESGSDRTSLKRRLDWLRAGLLIRSAKPEEAFKLLEEQFQPPTDNLDEEAFFNSPVAGRVNRISSAAKGIEAPSPTLSTP